MIGSIKKINGVYPITRAEAVYVDDNTTLKKYLETANNSDTSSKIGFLNVKSFGAVGDGVADDSVAIQSAIDSIRNGGDLYFPKGIYKINNFIKFYSNQKLMFEKGATLLRGLSTMNLMLTNHADNSTGEYRMTSNVQIIGATFDANASFNSNCTMLGFIHCDRVSVEDCTFKNQKGTWHCIEINASKYTDINKCVFRDIETSGGNGEMIQLDGALNQTVYPWDGLKDSTPCTQTTIRNCIFDTCVNSPAIGNHSNSPHTWTYIYGNTFANLTNSRGALAFVSVMSNIYIHDNVFINCRIGANTTAQNTFLYNNIFSDVTTVSSGNIAAKNNIVNNAYTS